MDLLCSFALEAPEEVLLQAKVFKQEKVSGEESVNAGRKQSMDPGLIVCPGAGRTGYHSGTGKQL